MKILIGCEFSGVVRDAFLQRGHNAMSCDLLPTEVDGPHYQGNLLEILDDGWDLAIFHPPCTHLAVSGARWFAGKEKEQEAALDFVKALLAAPIGRIALENPVSIISSKIRRPDQIVQPFMFGHMETKATCLWLKNLPKLQATDNVKTVMDDLPKSQKNRVHFASPSPDRWKERSRTLPGIAAAFAAQWGQAAAHATPGSGLILPRIRSIATRRSAGEI